MAGTIAADVLMDGAGNSTAMDNAIYGSAKAWICYKGTTTRGINSSYNVSSVTFNSTGNYTINFTNAFTDANYSYVTGVATAAASWNSAYMAIQLSGDTKSTTQFQVHTGYSDNGGYGVTDLVQVNLAFYR
jgi:hypothetical protein